MPKRLWMSSGGVLRSYSLMGLGLLLPELIHSTPVIASILHVAPLPRHNQGLKDGWLGGGALVFWKFHHASTPEWSLHQ